MTVLLTSKRVSHPRLDVGPLAAHTLRGAAGLGCRVMLLCGQVAGSEQVGVHQ